MLNITYNNVTVNPQRPEAQAKTFSSADVPHGTDSCIVKACKVANSNGLSWPMPPEFTAEEKAAFIASVKAEIQHSAVMVGEGEEQVATNKVIVGERDEMGNGVEIDFDAIETKDKLDTLMGLSPVSSKLKEGEAQTQLSNDPMHLESYLDLEAAKAKLIDDEKQRQAEEAIAYRIDQCLIVPELSEEFKAQFTLTDIPDQPM